VNNHKEKDGFNIRKLSMNELPPLLQEIVDPPKTLYQVGSLPDSEKNKYLCIVGSRKYSSYGKSVVEHLIEELRGYPVVIVSGMALGIDGIAHKSALDAGLKTIAVPGSGLSPSALYPRIHVSLANRIVHEGGTLLSEYEPMFKATPWSFPQRNRIMAGISHAVLVIEATMQSGTLITARLASEYNRDVLAIPGGIFNASSAGPHLLIKKGATPITNSHDLLEALGFSNQTTDSSQKYINASEEEQIILNLLDEPIEKNELIMKISLPISQANILLSTMELKGFIKEELGKVRKK
jgi:DNA processing protein